ncbi:MAG: flavodoxin family protein [Candidatus Wallbacteria bacterium]|nr:flavodoxin family protein [Candidatus Wallbacteria bacterium]
MKITAFVGSPRKEGNTARLVREIIAGALEAGAKTEIIHLVDKKINPCRSCHNCREHENCLIDDDMQEMYLKIHESDGLIIASPVYMWQMSSQTKTFVDRLVALLDPEFAPRLKSVKPTILAFTQGQPVTNSFNSYFKHTAGMLKMLGLDVTKVLIAGGTRGIDDIEQHKDVLKKARAAGKALAATVKKL